MTSKRELNIGIITRGDVINDKRWKFKHKNSVNPSSKKVADTIDQSSGPAYISKLFLDKYKSLYNRVPTDDSEMADIRDVIDNFMSK